MGSLADCRRIGAKAESQMELGGLLQRLIERIRPAKVVLFGSYADGTATADSDIDLLVIVG